MDRRAFTKLIGGGAALSAASSLLNSARAAEPMKIGFV